MVAAAIGTAAVVGAGASIYGANKAANAQEDAATRASDTQNQMFDITRQGLDPYVKYGNIATNMLTDRLPDLIKPVTMDQATLEATPGYKFNLSQGLKATQNAAAARGLGTSGAALKGAAAYATGLADNTYQNQFNNTVTNQTNAYNKLIGSATLGENAAAGTGSAALTTGANIGNNLVGAGNAQAAGYLQAGNAVGNAANTAAGGYVTNNLLNGMYSHNPGSGPASGLGRRSYTDLAGDQMPWLN